MKTALVCAKVAVSAGLLAVLLRRSDLQAILAQFRQMNLGWTAAALAIYGAMLIVSAWRWRLLLRAQTVHVSFGWLAQSFMVATFFNNFLPSNIGGDVVRVVDTAPYARSKTLAATIVLTDRIIGLVALLAVGALASAAAVWSGIPLAGVRYLWLALLLVMAGVVVLLGKPELIARVTREAVSAWAAGIQPRIDNLVHAITRFSQQPSSLWMAFAGAVVVQALLVLFYLCAAYSLAVPFPVLAASVVVPVSLAVQMVPLSINGFGVREAVFAFFFASLGLDVSSALALSLGSAGLVMIFSLGGGVVFLMRSRGPLAMSPSAIECS